jgi:hypothetical protein
MKDQQEGHSNNSKVSRHNHHMTGYKQFYSIQKLNNETTNKVLFLILTFPEGSPGPVPAKLVSLFAGKQNIIFHTHYLFKSTKTWSSGSLALDCHPRV